MNAQLVAYWIDKAVVHDLNLGMGTELIRWNLFSTAPPHACFMMYKRSQIAM